MLLSTAQHGFRHRKSKQDSSYKPIQFLSSTQSVGSCVNRVLGTLQRFEWLLITDSRLNTYNTLNSM